MKKLKVKEKHGERERERGRARESPTLKNESNWKKATYTTRNMA